MLSNPDSEPVCFDTFSQSIEYATNGRVFLSKDDTPETVTDEMLNGSFGDMKNVSSKGSVVIGIEYDSLYFSEVNGSYVFTAAAGCDKGKILYKKMPSGWDNRVSSAKAFSNCNHSLHFEYKNFGGAVRDCGTACPHIGGALNNKTSSIKWKN